MLDYSKAKEPTHYCNPPEIIEWGERPDYVDDEVDLRPPPIVSRLREGTRFICDECGHVQVVYWQPERISGNVAVCGNWGWRDETRWERFKRWWEAR